jgi:hypothetical protein
MKGPRKAIRAHAGSLSVCRYDVACRRFVNKLLERSAAKNSARVTRSNNFGRGQSALENASSGESVGAAGFLEIREA